MGTQFLDLIKTLPAELLAGVALAAAILVIAGAAVRFIESTFRKGLVSQANARRLSLTVVLTAVIGAMILIISLVVLYLWDTFGGASPI